MHPDKVDRFIRLVSTELNGAGIYSAKADNRARNIAHAGVNGMKLTPYVVTDFLKPTSAVDGIDNDVLRVRTAIEISRIWIYITSKSASDACLRLHLDATMTKKAAAQWMLRKEFVSKLVYDSLIRDHYHGGVDSGGIITDDQTGMTIEFERELRKDPRRGLIQALRKLEMRRRILRGE